MKQPIYFVLLICFIAPTIGTAVPGDIIDSISVPGTCPTGLAWDGNFLWVADRKTDTLYHVDPTDGSIKKSIPSPAFWPMGLTWDGTFLWNADIGEEVIYKIDPESGQVVYSIPTPCPSPRGLAYDGNNLWLCDDTEDKVYQVSPEDGTIISSFPSPSRSPTGLSYDGTYLWIADRVQDEIYMVNPDRAEVIIILDSIAPYIRGLAWDGNYLWANDYQTDKIYKLKIIDEEYYSIKNERTTVMEYTHEFRNYGPGTIVNLDIYVAVPQTLSNQKISADIEYNPQPRGFLTDQYGQTVAHYQFSHITAPDVIQVSMKVQAKIYDTHYFIFPHKIAGLNNIPKEIKQTYLSDGSKYRMHDPVIQAAVTEAAGDENDPYWIARKIFKYVIEHIEYERIRGWDAAPAVLERGTGSCSEYTCVFIAMCRAAGLPARYAGAVSLRGDEASLDNVFHRWAEVYLPGYGWIPVDPGRGDSESLRRQATSFGMLYNSILITTLGGGGSTYLGWNYNSNAEWQFEGKVKAHVERLAEWESLEEK